MDAENVAPAATSCYGVIGTRLVHAVARQSALTDIDVALFVESAEHLDAMRNKGGTWQKPPKTCAAKLTYGCMMVNQAIVILEMIAAIRTLTRAASDGSASIAKANTTLGIAAWRC